MFLIDYKFLLGEQIVGFVDWLILYGVLFFDKIFDIFEFFIYGVINGLFWFNLLVLIVLLVGLVYFIQCSWGLIVFVLVLLLLIFNLGYWQEIMEIFVQVIFVILVCIVVGVLLGIVVVYKLWFYIVLWLLLDLMQMVLIFVYLILILILFGFGVVLGLIFMVIFVVVVLICLICLGIQDVLVELFDVGKVFGCLCW